MQRFGEVEMQRAAIYARYSDSRRADMWEYSNVTGTTLADTAMQC